MVIYWERNIMNTSSLREKMIDLISQYGTKIATSWKYTSVKDNEVLIINSPLNIKFMSNYSNAPARNNLLGIIDESAFGNMKKGWLFALDGIYVSEDLSKPVVIPFAGIKDVYISKDSKKDYYRELTIDYKENNCKSITITTPYVNKTPLMEYLLAVKELNDKIENDSDFQCTKKRIADCLRHHVNDAFPDYQTYYYDKLDDDKIPNRIKEKFRFNMGDRLVAVLDMPYGDDTSFQMGIIITADEFYVYWPTLDFSFNFQHDLSITCDAEDITLHFSDGKGANYVDSNDYNPPFANFVPNETKKLIEELHEIVASDSSDIEDYHDVNTVVTSIYTGKSLYNDAMSLIKERIKYALSRNYNIGFWDLMSESEKKNALKILGNSINDRIIAIVDTSITNTFSSGYAFTTVEFIDFKLGKLRPYRICYADISVDSLSNNSKLGIQYQSPTIIWENEKHSDIYRIDDDFRILGFKELISELKVMAQMYGEDFRVNSGFISLSNNGPQAEQRAFESASYEYAQKYRKQTQAFEQERNRLVEEIKNGKSVKSQMNDLLDKYEDLINELNGEKRALENYIEQLENQKEIIKTDLRQ